MADQKDSAGYKKYWDEERETMPPKEREKSILERMKYQLEYVYNKLPFYRKHYDAHNFKPSDVKYIEDFSTKVPVIEKKMLLADQKENPPFGSYLGVSLEEIIRINGSAGTTTGVPTYYGISKKDWERIAEVEAMCTWAAGVRPSDVVQITYPFTLWLGGWAVLAGLDRIGSANFPLGLSESKRHVNLMYQLKSTVLWGTASYVIHLAEIAKQMGFDTRESPLRMTIVAGEPGGQIPATRKYIEDTWNASVHDSGSTSEMCPFQTNIECEAHCGTHVYTDEIYTEIVNKDNANEPKKMGERGAIVYTHLYRESQPMIRMWAGDESYMVDELCPCGRTYPRLPEGLIGRIDDMLVIRGANIYPSAIEDVLRHTPGIGTEFRVIVEKKGILDEISAQAEYELEFLSGLSDAQRKEALDKLAIDASANMKTSLGVRLPVSIVELGTFERTTLKAKRVIDKRKS